MNKKINNIYLDTNILVKLGKPFYSSSEFKDLKSIVDKLEAKIYVPEVVYNEYEYGEKINFDKKLKKYEDIVNEINEKVNTKIDIVDFEFLKKENIGILKEKFKENEINIVNTPIEEIDIKEKIHDAINMVKPFSGDQGFKDSIILDTIIKHCEDIKSNSGNIFFTCNKDFDGVNLKKGINLNMKILNGASEKGLSELKDYLLSFLDKTIKERVSDNKDRLSEYLIDNKEKIREFILQQTMYDYRIFELNLGETIKEIKLIDIIEISNISGDFIEEKITDKINEFSFKAKTKFMLTISSISSISGLTSGTSATVTVNEQYKEIIKNIPIKCEVTINIKNHKYSYSAIKLKEIIYNEIIGVSLNTPVLSTWNTPVLSTWNTPIVPLGDAVPLFNNYKICDKCSQFMMSKADINGTIWFCHCGHQIFEKDNFSTQ